MLSGGVFRKWRIWGGKAGVVFAILIGGGIMIELIKYVFIFLVTPHGIFCARQGVGRALLIAGWQVLDPGGWYILGLFLVMRIVSPHPPLRCLRGGEKSGAKKLIYTRANSLISTRSSAGSSPCLRKLSALSTAPPYGPFIASLPRPAGHAGPLGGCTCDLNHALWRRHLNFPCAANQSFMVSGPEPRSRLGVDPRCDVYPRLSGIWVKESPEATAQGEQYQLHDPPQPDEVWTIIVAKTRAPGSHQTNVILLKINLRWAS